MRIGCRGIKIAACLLAAALGFGICGCATENEADTVRITVVDSIFFQAETSAAQVSAGDDFSTVLRLLSGYALVSCDYEDYVAQTLASGDVRLTLKRVRRPSRVTVACAKEAIEPTEQTLRCTIFYDYNGGTNGGAQSGFEKEYILTQHIRPNTWNGDGLEREGYTLTGWNTKSDGGGERVGLGSRVTVENGGAVTLYAQWAKWAAAEDFLYKAISPNEISLTGYRGKDVSPFVVPAEIGGKRVTEIAASFTTNMPCGALTAQTLVLPNYLRTVRDNAFLRSSFSEIVFFDSLENVGAEAFPQNIKTYRINAVREPCFQKTNNSAHFADNMDRVIVNADRKKMIFFAGCSFAYGLNGYAVDDAFGDYAVCNMGVNGDINGAFQMEIMLNYLGAGDVFVHAPEQMSACQLMFSFYVNDFMFIMAEGNYDLLSLADFSDNGGVWNAYQDYIELKKEADPCTYEDGRAEDFNEYGDYICERPYDEATESERDVTYSDDAYCYDSRLLTEQSVKKLTGYYDAVRARGAAVCVSYGPVNGSARARGEIAEKGEEFAARFEEMLAPYGYAPISEVKDYIFEGRYFYDSDYHLNDVGAALRTERLIADLLAAGVS